MVTNNPFINHSANSFPRISQLTTKNVSQWITWSKGYVVEDDYRFQKTPYLLRTTFGQRRGGMIRAFASGLKSGDGIYVSSAGSYRKDYKECERIGNLLWNRVVKARGRRFDYDGPITRAEVMYMSRFPDADLRGKELHHINWGRTHLLWRLNIKAQLTGARLPSVDNLESLLLALDDRPMGLIALTPREHFLIHLIEGTPYYGEFIENVLEAGDESVSLELFKKVWGATNLGQTNINLNQGSHCSRVVKYDEKGPRCLSMVNGDFTAVYFISFRTCFKGRKGDSSLASMSTRYTVNMEEMQTIL